MITSSLQVLGQHQQWIVYHALHLTCALHRAGHLQLLPHHLGHHNDVTDEGSHLAQGQGIGQQSIHPARQR